MYLWQKFTPYPIFMLRAVALFNCRMVIVSTQFSHKDETFYVRIDQTCHLMLFTYAESESVTRQKIFLLHNPPNTKTKWLPN